jgi:hypothetical protein
LEEKKEEEEENKWPADCAEWLLAWPPINYTAQSDEFWPAATYFLADVKKKENEPKKKKNGRFWWCFCEAAAL